MKKAELNEHKLQLMAAMATINEVADLIEKVGCVGDLDPLPRTVVHLVALAATIRQTPQDMQQMVMDGCIGSLPFLVEALASKDRTKLQ